VISNKWNINCLTGNNSFRKWDDHTTGTEQYYHPQEVKSVTPPYRHPEVARSVEMAETADPWERI